MNDAVLDYDAPIGRRSSPRLASEIPLSGVHWQGPTRFVIREERPGAFRWILVSSDGRDLQLAQSASVFLSPAACSDEVRRLDAHAEVRFEYHGQVSYVGTKSAQANVAWTKLEV